MVELTFSPGDEVRLRLAQEEVEGTVLESFDSSIVLIKLLSGYNVGIPKENILNVRVLGKNKTALSSPKTSALPVQNPSLPSIGLIITGGTIASKLDPKTGGVKWLTDVSEFLRFYPEMKEIVNIKHIEVPFMIASESMNSEHWITIAQTAKQLLDDPDIKGVVITHGTDTLHYTAAALSFFLRNLGKPVVLTYSQRSIDRASSDAHLNLICAARMALSDYSGVTLVGHASTNDDYCYALPGAKARKLHSSRRDAFKAVNADPIAKVYADKVEFISSHSARNDSKTEVDTQFTDKVALIKYYPGQDSSILDFCALKYKGVVIEVLGLGHLPVSEASNNWLPALKKHIKNGLVICVAPQTIYGRLDPYVYSNGRELLDAGVIFLEDMTSETAFIKLGWVLGHYGWKKNVQEKMLENIAGERSDRLLSS